jgi:hypothetical protein
MNLKDLNSPELNEDWGLGGAMAKNFIDRLRGKATGHATGQASRESKFYIDNLVGGASNAIQQMIQSGAVDPSLPAPTAPAQAPAQPTPQTTPAPAATKPAKAAKPSKKSAPKKKKPVMIGGKVMDPKNPDHAKLMKLASKAKKNLPEAYDRLNFILESVMLTEAMSIYDFLKTNYLPKFLRGQDVDINDPHVDSLIRDVQNSWKKDQGKAALTKLGQFAFASGTSKGGQSKGSAQPQQSAPQASPGQTTQAPSKPTGAAPAKPAPGVDEIIRGIGKVSGSNAPASLAYVVNTALTKFKKIDPAGHKAFLSQIQITPDSPDKIKPTAAG